MDDAAYEDLQEWLTTEQIIEIAMLCARTLGVGTFAQCMGVITWKQA